MERDEKKWEEQPVEVIFAGLEDVLAKLEQEDVSLEKSFALYHQGMEMLRLCSEKIDAVEKQMLVLDESGERHEF